MEKLERRFGTFTRDLEELAEWLEEHHVTHLVMEATGVYWKPVWNVLEGRFDLMLVNPPHSTIILTGLHQATAIFIKSFIKTRNALTYASSHSPQRDMRSTAVIATLRQKTLKAK